MNWMLVRKDELAYLRQRIRELEKQNASLLDRVLIERGNLPIEKETREELQASFKEAENQWAGIMLEDTGIDDLMAESDNGEEALSSDS